MPNSRRFYIHCLNDVAASIVEWRIAKGFETPSTFTDETADHVLTKLALIHSEVGEATEAVRHGDLENFGEELADTVIRILDLTGTLGIDLAAAIEDKMLANILRPHKHGKRN